MGDGVSEWFPKQFCASTILDSRFRGNDWQECHSPLDGESTRLLGGRFLCRQKAPQKPTGTTKKPARRGLTLAPGDYSRVCKQTVPGARIFSPHLSFRFFHQAGTSPAHRPPIKKRVPRSHFCHFRLERKSSSCAMMDSPSSGE